MLGKSILFSEMRPAPSWEDRFNDWYDTEHIPLRMHVKGFQSAQRYCSADGNYLAVYELESLAVFSTPAFSALKTKPSDTTAWMLANVQGFTRYVGNEISVAGSVTERALNAPVLLADLRSVPEASLQDLDAWFEEEHVPRLLESEGCLMVRRFTITSGEPRKFNRLALHYLASADVLPPVFAMAEKNEWCSNRGANALLEARRSVFMKHGNRQARAS